MANEVSTKKTVADALRDLADKVENGPGTVSLDLSARIWRPMTAELLLKKEEAAKAGYVVDVESPLHIEIRMDGRNVVS